MPGERIVLDSLWRCLCPSVDAIALSKALQTLSARFVRTSQPCRREYSTQPATARHTAESAINKIPVKSEEVHEKERELGVKIRRYILPNDSPGNLHEKLLVERLEEKKSRESTYLARVWKRSQVLPKTLFRRRIPFDDELDTIDVHTILDSLRELQFARDQYHKIAHIVRYLVTRRNQKPDAFLYECLIRANVDPRHGSARVVIDLLNEMNKAGIIQTSSVYHAILDVLSVHPDYVLRNKVLREMKQAWINLTTDGQVAVALGLLRDGQYEMALDNLENMFTNAVPIPRWVYDIFIFAFGENGFHKETLMIIQHVIKHPNRPVSTPAWSWSFLLDVFSRDGFYEGLKYVWDRLVTPGTLIPSDGLLARALIIASHNGDSAMATAVIKMLSARGRKLDLQHFEPLVDIHAGDRNVRRAFSTLCLMRKAGLHPGSSSTRPIFRILRENPVEVQSALAILEELREQQKIPIAVVNVVLEATLTHHGFKRGLELYRDVRKYCPDGPDLTTFKLLLSECVYSRSLRFILAEMRALNIKPDLEAYDRIIMICTYRHDSVLAFEFLEQLKTTQPKGSWMSRETALGLIRKCLIWEEARVQDLVEECEKRGMSVKSTVQLMAERIRENKVAKEKELADKALLAQNTPRELALVVVPEAVTDMEGPREPDGKKSEPTSTPESRESTKSFQSFLEMRD